ncbi:MAG: hypothetical protein R3C97_01125 [Geminicoccaceae bacterium]
MKSSRKARPAAILLACTIAAGLFTAPPAHAADLAPSLFFLPEEVAAIFESRRAGGGHGPVASEPGRTTVPDGGQPAIELPRYIHLSAILRQADGSFEVWINGRPYQRLGGNDHWQIVGVGDDRVRLRLQQDGHAGRIVEIAANQTFDLGGGRTIEGRPASLHEQLAVPVPRIR